MLKLYDYLGEAMKAANIRCLLTEEMLYIYQDTQANKYVIVDTQNVIPTFYKYIGVFTYDPNKQTAIFTNV